MRGFSLRFRMLGITDPTSQQNSKTCPEQQKRCMVKVIELKQRERSRKVGI